MEFVGTYSDTPLHSLTARARLLMSTNLLKQRNKITYHTQAAPGAIFKTFFSFEIIGLVSTHRCNVKISWSWSIGTNAVCCRHLIRIIFRLRRQLSDRKLKANFTSEYKLCYMGVIQGFHGPYPMVPLSCEKQLHFCKIL